MRALQVAEQVKVKVWVKWQGGSGSESVVVIVVVESCMAVISFVFRASPSAPPPQTSVDRAGPV